ncbi:MAG: carboxypeptidase regulatory-like domain-containing protein [Saprospiraceae bacterium]
MIAKRKLFFLALILLLPAISFTQTPTQTLRGTITDAGNARPLLGATIVLLETSPALGTTSGKSGQYRLEEVPVGRYRMQVSYVGYETVTVAEVLVEAGKEAVFDVQLHERQEALHEVVVKAAGKTGASPQALGVRTITVEEQFRFPATFYDPARLAMSFPGVTGVSDGTNIISVRGNSPASVRWRLEGVDIVNPNHTANAGTIGDRPTQAGGGVTILSAQLLGASSFLLGNYPAEYGDATGGILDMRLRDGNNHRHEFTVQAGFLGLEAAVEGPVGRRRLAVSGEQEGGASYLVNYRYSFTGLLTAMGTDFGDEETAFQDVSFHVSIPAKKAGKFALFGVGGKSKTIFRSPVDSALITENKEQFDIDFHSEMGALGLTHTLPAGKNGVWRTATVSSALQHRRTADLVESPAVRTRWEDDDVQESKTGFSSVFSQKINARHQFKAGFQAYHDVANFDHFFTSLFYIELQDEFESWLLQPFIEWHGRLSAKLEATAGVRGSYFSFGKKWGLPEPRIELKLALTPNSSLSFAYGLHTQRTLPQVYVLSQMAGRQLGLIKSQQYSAGYRREFRHATIFSAEAYFQYLWDVPVSPNPNREFSVLNTTGFSTQHFSWFATLERFESLGLGRNYGLDLSLQKFISQDYYFLLTGSLYRSEFNADGYKWYSTRFDGRYLMSLTGGREFIKQKEGKMVTKGINGRMAWHGGYRTSPVDTTFSPDMGYTVFLEREAFSRKLPDYFRIDLRFYLKWNKAGRNSILSLDIQNATNRKNTDYEYYDDVQDKIATKLQLGMIPILSYRVEF